MNRIYHEVVRFSSTQTFIETHGVEQLPAEELLTAACFDSVDNVLAYCWCEDGICCRFLAGSVPADRWHAGGVCCRAIMPLMPAAWPLQTWMRSWPSLGRCRTRRSSAAPWWSCIQPRYKAMAFGTACIQGAADSQGFSSSCSARFSKATSLASIAVHPVCRSRWCP